MPRGVRKNNPEAVAKVEAARIEAENKIRADERAKVEAEFKAGAVYKEGHLVSAPAFIRKMVESQEHEPAAQTAREFNANGELPVEKIQTQDGHHLGGELERLGFDANGKRIRGKKWHDEMAFANEMVTVRVHQSTDKNAHPLPDVYVNGRVQRFPRGEEINVRRCFVERLARAMATTYGNVKVKGPDGEDKYIYPQSSAEVYPFTVIGDTPKGEAWLKNLLRTPQ
jgi:hypothetical protein